MIKHKINYREEQNILSDFTLKIMFYSFIISNQKKPTHLNNTTYGFKLLNAIYENEGLLHSDKETGSFGWVDKDKI